VREALARDMRVDATDDFALLALIGHECAGAVELWQPGERDSTAAHSRLVPLSHEELEAWIAQRPRAAFAGHSDTVRLSLAGAQHKLGVRLQPDGSLALPEGRLASTHILKIPNPDFPHLVQREMLGLAIAQHCGVPVAAVELYASPTLSLLVTRFDRRVTQAGDVERIHQEDICQSLALAPERKYEQDGGIGAARVFQLLRNELRLGGAPLQAVLRWLAVNLLLGNADAHAKNLGTLRHADGRIELAPLYDLVPTILYPALDRQLAMRIGKAKSLDDVHEASWDQLAADAGLGTAFVRAQVRQVGRDALAHLAATAEALQRQGANAAVLAHDAEVLRARAQALAAGKDMPAPPQAWRQRPPEG
jgi:serine/threonine-protein kinase HipA